MLRSKFITAVFSMNTLVAPAAFGAVLITATPAAADPPVECWVIEIVCSRKDPSICEISEPMLDPDCDGVPG